MTDQLLTPTKVIDLLKISRLIVLAALFFLLGLTACSGQVPDASKARSRAVIDAGAIVPAEEIRVAEYLQYYEQNFPEPEQGTVGLELRPGNGAIPTQGGTAWLQIGLQAKSEKADMVAPLNLALVIDRSGSMADADKMPYLKQSLNVFLESLGPEDIVSIVTYSDEAELLWPAQPVGDGRWIGQMIDRIEPGGSTNLHAGMMLGFEQVDNTFDLRRNHRVILLTDGIANRGVVDPDQIAAAALEYNRRGIYLSTIGLGLEFNDALLSQLARQGQGGYSFIDSAREMDRVFREQVVGLKQRVAGEVSVTLIPEAGVRLVDLTGLTGSLPPGGATVPLNPMGTGDSQVLLARLEVEPTATVTERRPLATVRLDYFDEFAQRPASLEQTIWARPEPSMEQYDPVKDLDVLRNVTIQEMAEGLQEIDRLFQAGTYERAWQLAARLESRLAHVARLADDERLWEDVSLMQRYRETLAEALWQAEGRRPAQVEDEPPLSLEARSESRPMPESPAPTVEIR